MRGIGLTRFRRFGMGTGVLISALVVVAVPSGHAAPARGPAAIGEAQAGGSRASIPRVEAAIRRCVNKNRRARGLQALERNPVLDQAARFHARQMLTQGFFSHFDRRGRGPAERVELFDQGGELTNIGENISAGDRSASSACRGWMSSSGHRGSILRGGYTQIGAGFARGRRGYGTYYVQVFGDLVPVEPLPQLLAVISNVDEQSWVTVNGSVVGSVVGYGGTAQIGLGQLTENDVVAFQVANGSGPGWTYGWELYADDRLVFREADGTVGQVGARGNDQSCINTTCYRVYLRATTGEVLAREGL